MRVLFLPDHTDGNPYQRKLAEGLVAEGIDVSLASGYPLSTLRTILRSRPDVVHVHWIAPFLISGSLPASLLKSIVFLQATLLAKALGIDIVWTVHNILDHDRRQPRFELFARRVYARLSDAIIVHCAAAEETVVRRYGLTSREKTTVVPHGHYGSSYEDDIDRATARERLGLDPEAITFLYLGQIRPYKQVPRLVDAFGELPDEDVRLVVAGKPTDEAEARRTEVKSRDDGRITTEFGYIPDESLQVYLNAADAVVLPYRNILTSGSAILAMTFGKPVVGPRVGCLTGLLDQQDELLYDPETDSLADVLRRAADADLATLGEQNRQHVMELDWDEISSATRDIYDRS